MACLGVVAWWRRDACPRAPARRFLYEPFPVESCLHEQLHDHLNAEVVGGTVRSKQDALDFLTWTYFYRRLLQNPAYYAAGSASGSDVGAFASDLVETTLDDLACAGCVEISADDDHGVAPTTLGRIASYYYLSHQTVALFSAELAGDEGQTELPTLLRVLCSASEYAELPVRHNEEHVNEQMAHGLPWAVDESQFESPHVKAALLLQARCPPTRAVSFAPLGAA